MGRWSKAAQVRKAVLDGQKERAGDLEILLSEIGKLPPGQLKKVLTEPVLAVLAKYGVAVE